MLAFLKKFGISYQHGNVVSARPSELDPE